MKLQYVILALPLFASQLAGATEQTVRFSGAVRAGGAVVNGIVASVPFGQTKAIMLPSGLKLEMQSPSRASDEAVTIVKLLKFDGKAYNIVHVSHRTGPAPEEITFGYLVCGEKVSYFSPPPASIPTCQEQAASK